MPLLPTSSVSFPILRHRIKVLERPAERNRGVLPFGVGCIDAALPWHGLPRAALHEVSSLIDTQGERSGSPSLMFAAGVAARLPGRTLWCSRVQDLFLPGLLGAGMDPDRVLCAEAPDEAGVLQVMEEGLRHPGLACVIGELARLPITASRRLNLAAEASGVMAIALHRGGWRAGASAIAPLPTAAVTRWRVGPSPSPAPPMWLGSQRSGPLAIPGRSHWRLELTRCRGGEAASWIVEACDAQGRLALPAQLGDRPARPRGWSGERQGAPWRLAG